MSSSRLSSTGEGCRRKLPSLELPKFDGDPEKWTPIFDSFLSTVDSHSSLEPLNKFRYLLNCLSGIAKDTLTGINVTNANYTVALELLRSRFGNKQIIISRHMESLINLPKVQSSNVQELRTLHDKTEGVIRSLRGIGINSDSYGIFVTPILMSKISPELRITLTRNLSEEWDLDGVMQEFGKELQLRERCEYSTMAGAANSLTEGRKNTRKVDQIQPSTTSVFYNQGGASYQGEREPSCVFCGGLHFWDRCTSVTDPFARRRVLRQKGRCFLCMKGSHIARDCMTTGKCRVCGGRHHTSICGNNRNSRFNRNQSGIARQDKASSRGMIPKQPATTNLLVNHDMNKKQFLMPTAQGSVSNPSDKEDGTCEGENVI